MLVCFVFDVITNLTIIGAYLRLTLSLFINSCAIVRVFRCPGGNTYRASGPERQMRSIMPLPFLSRGVSRIFGHPDRCFLTNCGLVYLIDDFGVFFLTFDVIGDFYLVLGISTFFRLLSLVILVIVKAIFIEPT